MKTSITILAFMTCNLFFGQQSLVKPALKNILGQFSNLRDFTMTKNEKEAYFTLQTRLREVSVILSTKKINDVWQAPEIASFSGQHSDLEPMLSPDELRLYFASNRPLDNSTTESKDYDIWYVERESMDSAWSIPINVGPIINSQDDEYYPSVGNSGNLYFTRLEKGSETQDDIYISEWKNGTYTKPELLGDGVNSAKAEYNAYVSPNEDYIIFGSWQREGSFGGGDLFISYKKNDMWTPAENLGEKINSNRTDYCPFVNIKNNTLYFTSNRSTIKQNKSGYKNMNALMIELNKYENGSSRIYKVDFSNFLKK